MPALVAQFADEVRQVYREAIADQDSRLHGGNVLWSQFESIVDACLNGGDFRQLTEKVNELAVAKILLDDPHLTGLIHYEPPILSGNRRIDFVADRASDSLYVEVKTIHPKLDESERSWNLFVERSQYHPENVNFITNEGPMGGALYGGLLASRSKFLGYALAFEQRLQEAKLVRHGPGVLVYCGNGFAWDESQLEDFVDFYHLGTHRDDDLFSVMEQHYIQDKCIVLTRNIDHFAYLRRPIELPQQTEFRFGVRGPRFGAPAGQ